MGPRDQPSLVDRQAWPRDVIAPWRERKDNVTPELRVPPWLAAAIAGSVALGPIAGLASRRAPGRLGLVRTIFFSSAFGYLVTSLADFAEHFRLEKEVTGRYFGATVVPPGETLNHAATIATVLSSLALVRPPPRRLRARDLWSLAAPGIFLALGWRDEFVYHRKRSTHREDMMHTIPHLAAGIMWAALYTMRFLDRDQRRVRRGRR